MYTLIVLIIGFLLGKWYAGHRASVVRGEMLNEERHQAKEAAKARVLELFKDKQEIGNDDVEHALGISDATATNYLQELKDEGKISQIGGDEGRFVKYRLNA